MTADLPDASSDMSRELSPEWVELSARVRKLATEAGSGTPLAQNAILLCDHVERLHSDVGQLLARLAAPSAGVVAGEPLDTLPAPPATKIDEANIEIQREMHQKSDLKHIIKALFMWKDDPVERARDRIE